MNRVRTLLGRPYLEQALHVTLPVTVVDDG
jgi:hypothetical protein